MNSYCLKRKVSDKSVSLLVEFLDLYLKDGVVIDFQISYCFTIKMPFFQPKEILCIFLPFIIPTRSGPNNRTLGFVADH